MVENEVREAVSGEFVEGLVDSVVVSIFMFTIAKDEKEYCKDSGISLSL